MKQKGKTIIIWVVAIITIGLIAKNIHESKSLDNNGVYVIGKINKIDGARQGVRIFVSYIYKGKLYKNDYIVTDFNENTVSKKKYFFLIDSSHPTRFNLEYNVPVPDSLHESPYNGWDSLPIKNTLP